MNAKELIQQINEQVQKNANVRVVFGEPIEKGTLTIIPVAKVTLRGGGGGGQGGMPICTPTGKFNITQVQVQGPKSDPDPSAPKPNEEKTPTGNYGMGLGLEIKTTPLGYIEIKDGQARFREIEDATRVALAGIALAAFVFLSVTRIVAIVARSSQRKSKKALQQTIPKGK